MTEEDDEQVIGALLRCEVCEAKTLHVDGVCQDHKIVRRRKQHVAPATRRDKIAAERAAEAAAAAARSGRGLRRVITVLVLGGLIWLMGATHVLHGDKSGVAFCWKAGWSLADTFVDTDKLATAKPPRKVLDALATCAY